MSEQLSNTQHMWKIGSEQLERAQARYIVFASDRFVVELTDGRELSVPIDWFPRLVHGTEAERNRWELLGDGEGIHWPDLDEDIEVVHLLLGNNGGEGKRSFERWLAERESKEKADA